MLQIVFVANKSFNVIRENKIPHKNIVFDLKTISPFLMTKWRLPNAYLTLSIVSGNRKRILVKCIDWNCHLPGETIGIDLVDFHTCSSNDSGIRHNISSI